MEKIENMIRILVSLLIINCILVIRIWLHIILLAILTKTPIFFTLDSLITNLADTENCPIGYICDLNHENFRSKITKNEPKLLQLHEEFLKRVLRIFDRNEELTSNY